MTLYVKGYYFNGANFSLVYNQNEGERIYLDQIRSPSQSYAAVFLRESTDTDNTVIHLFRNDGTQVYRLAVGEPAKQWAVSDAGEVLIYTEVPTDEDEKEKIIRCYNSAGSQKWSVTLTGILGNQTVSAVGIGTDYASVVYSDTIRFYDVDTGENTKIIQTGKDIGGSQVAGFYNMRYSSTGHWIVYLHHTSNGIEVLFVNSDGSWYAWKREDSGLHGKSCRTILSADAACSKVIATFRYSTQSWRHTLFFRETGRVATFDYSETTSLPRAQSISPCGSWLNKESTLYQIKADGVEEYKSIAWASGESGCKDCDLSYYGRYLLVRHDSGKVWAYDFEDGIELDYVENPLKSKVIILCAD